MDSIELQHRLLRIEPTRLRACRAGVVRMAALFAVGAVTAVLCFVAALGAPILAAPWVGGRVWLVFVLFFAAPMVVIILGVIVGCRVHTWLAHASADAYYKQYFNEILEPLLAGSLPRANIQAGEVLERDVFVAGGLFPAPSTRRGTVRIEGHIESRRFVAAAVEASAHVVRVGSSDSNVRIVSGLFVWLAVVGAAPTPVLVVDPAYFSERYRLRRHDLVRGRTDDDAFDEAFVVCVHQDEHAVPPLGAQHRAVLTDLRQGLGVPLF